MQLKPSGFHQERGFCAVFKGGHSSQPLASIIAQDASRELRHAVSFTFGSLGSCAEQRDGSSCNEVFGS
jgi:hypothetical protein